MKGKKIWGIELALKNRRDVGSVIVNGRTYGAPMGHIIMYAVKISSRVSGKPIHDPRRMFITDKILHSQLEKSADRLIGFIGEQVGSMSVHVDLRERTIRTEFVHPFQHIPENHAHGFERKGLASRIEQRLEEHLRHEFPGFSIRTGDAPSTARKAQIEKRGRKPKEPIPIAEAIRLTRAQNRKNFQKHHVRPSKHPH